MGETDLHRQLMIDLTEALRHFYAADPEVYVTGNLLLLYEEYNPHAHLSPDVMVVRGVPKRSRENFLIWEEKAAPALIIEVTSRTTRMRDTGVKKGLYAAIGVTEYLLFDPLGDYLRPRFQAFRLEGDTYVPVPLADNSYVSLTGLEFRYLVGDGLRIFHQGRMLPTPQEQALRADAAERRAAELEARLRELGG